MAIPGGIELANLFIGAVIGGILKLAANKQAADAERHRMTMEIASMRSGAVSEARNHKQEGQTTGFHITRRIIAIMGAFFIIAWPKIVPVFDPSIPVSVSYSEFIPSNWFGADKDVVQWIVAEGLTITPADNVLIYAILGLFFGSEIVKRT